jgi:hypothetical protein
LPLRRDSAYPVGMAFPRPSRPGVLLADLKAFFSGGERHKFVAGGVAILMPVIIMAGFYVDSKKEPPKPQLIYVQEFAADRTDDDIRKQNIADQKDLDARREAKRKEWQRLADKMGIE